MDSSRSTVARAQTSITCSRCGKAASVPFTPTPGRPVLCHDCFRRSQPARPAPGAAGSRGPPPRAAPNAMPRKRMMAQGRKGHFVHDARAMLVRTEGGMDDNNVRAFLEGLFARGARTSTEAAQEFLDEKLADETITIDQRKRLGDLVEQYSFWR